MAATLRSMPQYASGALPSAMGRRITIVAGEWNAPIVQSLLQAARNTLLQHQAQPQDIAVEYVPGAFELPLGAQRAIEGGGCNAVICLGCVIQGETRHFDFICTAAAQGIMEVMLKTGVPVIFGVLTANTLEQAQERAGGKYGNKGAEAAEAALRMMRQVN